MKHHLRNKQSEVLFMLQRRADSRDTDALLSLYASCIGLPFCAWSADYPNAEILADDLANEAIYLLEENNQPLAAVSVLAHSLWAHDGIPWQLNERPVMLARVCVRPDLQGQGIGTRFLSGVLEALAAQGFRAARLAVDKNHLAAIRLYEKLGFSRCGEVYKYEENFYCYERPLTNSAFPR